MGQLLEGMWVRTLALFLKDGRSSMFSVHGKRKTDMGYVCKYLMT